MRLIRHCACIAGIVVVSAALASPAAAQQIRTYGNNNSGGEGTTSQSSTSTGGGGDTEAWYPGMPVPQQESGGEGQQSGAEQQKAAGEEGAGKEGEESVGPSHKISMFGVKSRKSPNQPRTTLDLAVEQLYRGVIPGKRNEVAHLARAKEVGAESNKPNQLTWLGFRPEDDSTRVFFQTARQSDYNIRRQQDPPLVEITLRNTRIPASNFSRFIDTSFFNRNVQLVEAEQIDRSTVEVRIELKTFEQPTVRRDGNYVYLDFPHSSPDKQNQGDDKVASDDGS